MNEGYVRHLLALAVERAGSQRAFAKHAKISESYLSDVLLGRRALGPAILNALGLEAVTRYHKLGSTRGPDTD